MPAGIQVQSINSRLVPYAGDQVDLLNNDSRSESGPSATLISIRKTIIHEKRDFKVPIILRNDLWVGDYFGHPALRPSGRPSDVQNHSR